MLVRFLDEMFSVLQVNNEKWYDTRIVVQMPGSYMYKQLAVLYKQHTERAIRWFYTSMYQAAHSISNHFKVYTLNKAHLHKVVC